MDSLDEAAAETQADARRAGIRLTDDEARRMATEAADPGPEAPDWVDAEGPGARAPEAPSRPAGRGRSMSLMTPTGRRHWRSGSLTIGQLATLRGMDLEGTYEFHLHVDPVLKVGRRGDWSCLYGDPEGRVHAIRLDVAGRVVAHAVSQSR